MEYYDGRPIDPIDPEEVIADRRKNLIDTEDCVKRARKELESALSYYRDAHKAFSPRTEDWEVVARVYDAVEGCDAALNVIFSLESKELSAARPIQNPFRDGWRPFRDISE